jgi:outer membrane protein OmpA-like peptidoglycan-associated protein
VAQASDIREHMEVRDAAGVPVGTVDHLEGDRIKLTRSGSPDGEHRYVPLSAVSRVDAQVHLNQAAAALGLGVAGATGGAAAGSAAGGEHPLPPVLNRAVDGAKPRGNFYLPWVVGAIGLLLLLLLFKGCATERREEAMTGPTTTMANTDPATGMGDNMVVGATAGAPAATPLGVSQLGGYLGGTDPTPTTFAFEKINFDTAKSDIRPQDRQELMEVATVLKQHQRARIRIAGYADARGSDPANAQLGKARAETVKAALVAQGVDGRLIETVSGGEGDPVNTNATAGGQAENRRTELVVVARQ